VARLWQNNQLEETPRETILHFIYLIRRLLLSGTGTLNERKSEASPSRAQLF